MSKKQDANSPKSTWIDIYNNLKELCITSFKWENLPNEINRRYLELTLFERGNIAFFRDDVMEKFLTLKTTSMGNLDVYGEPTKIQAFGHNGYLKVLKNYDECIVIYNNNVRDTPHLRLIDYAKRIYSIERTIDINLHAQRTPVLIKCTKKQEFTLNNLYRQYDEFKPVIITDVDIGANGSGICVLKTDAPYVADKMEEEKRKLWCEVLSYIGIENNFSEKNERLTRGEVLVSNGLAIANRKSKLESRQDAVEKINKMYSLNIKVSNNHLSVLDFEGDNLTLETNKGGEEIE